MYARLRRIPLTAVVLIGAFGGVEAPGLWAQSLPLIEMPARPAISVARSSRLAERAALQPLGELPAAEIGAADQLTAMRAWNDAQRLPHQVGFVRELPRVEVVLDEREVLRASGTQLLRRDDERITWTATFRVVGAHRLRLRLDDVRMPVGSEFWVYGEDEEVAFTLDLLDPEGGLWTPSVDGERLSLEIRTPTSSASPRSFRVSRVTQIVRAQDQRSRALKVGECLLDATCYEQSQPIVATISKAIGGLSFVVDNYAFDCTGGLLNTTRQDFIPYLLTANHCLKTQAGASSLEVFWDAKTTSCEGSVPDSFPRSNGAVLLATGQSTDFTLLRINQLPAGPRAFLGWSLTPPTSGQTLIRVSHPANEVEGFSYSQAYSTQVVDGSFPAHPAAPRPQFLYSSRRDGGVFGGSSGSPVTDGSGRVVGQLSGQVFTRDGCNSADRIRDGALAQTYPSIAQWLSPSPSGGTQPCQESLGNGAICLSGSRFEMKVTWTNPNAGDASQPVKVIRFSDTAAEGYYSNPSNVELLAKMLNGCSLNGRHWVFIGGVTDQNVIVDIRDSRTGATKRYENPRGSAFRTVADTQAFATCP